MGSQINVGSIDALKDLRVAMALYGDDTLGALGAVEAEVRRTLRWVIQEQPGYWREQIKRRKEALSSAQAELFRKKLAKSGSASTSEQVENVRRAEARLHDAEKRAELTKKWQPRLQHAVLEYHGSIRRLKTMAAGEVPRGVNLLSRLIDALEAYLQVTAPSGSGRGEASASSGPAGYETMAVAMIEAEPPAAEDAPEAEDDPIELDASDDE